MAFLMKQVELYLETNSPRLWIARQMTQVGVKPMAPISASAAGASLVYGRVLSLFDALLISLHFDPTTASSVESAADGQQNAKKHQPVAHHDTYKEKREKRWSNSTLIQMMMKHHSTAPINFHHAGRAEEQENSLEIASWGYDLKYTDWLGR